MNSKLYRILTLACVAAGALSAAGGQVTPLPGEPQEQALRERYETLNGRIYGTKRAPGPSEQQDVADELRAMITDRIRAVVSRATDARAVRDAVGSLQGKYALSSGREDETNTPFAELFTVNGDPGLAAAFVILRGGMAIPNTLPVMQFYVKEFGEWQLKAEVIGDLQGCSYMAARVDSPNPNQSWWLAWGQVYGNTRALRKLRLYSFDGAAVRTVWSRDDLFGGVVRVGEDRRRVYVEYDRSVGTADRPDFERVAEEWLLTLDGPALISTSIR